MIKNGEFFVSLGVSRLVDEFRAVAGCKNTAQAVDAMFRISSTLISDQLLKIDYTDTARTKKWNFTHAIKKAVASPEYKNTPDDEAEIVAMPMNPDRYIQLGLMEGHVYNSLGYDAGISDAFTMAVIVAHNLYREYGQGHVLNIPVYCKRGNPLTERHIYLGS